jgi:hypothetical protein
MSKILETWEVQEHGPLVEVDDGILVVDGTIKMPIGNFPRRMTVVRLAGGGNVVYSAIALAEPQMHQIEALGKPKFLVVPNSHHRMDAKIWKQRYPNLRVVAPSGARESVEEVVPVDDTSDVFADPDVKLINVGGMQDSELAILVSRAKGSTLVVNDVIANVAHPEGVGAKIMARLLGFGVRQPQTPRVVKFTLKDKAGLAKQFREWAKLATLRRIIVSHGDIIDQPNDVLETLAQALDG